jgi:hypothetical protein
MRYTFTDKDLLKHHARTIRTSDLLRAVTLIRCRRVLRELGAT